MLGYDEISKLEQLIQYELEENLLGILTKLNRMGKLEKALEVWELDHLLEDNTGYKVFKTGKIVVIGKADIQKDVMLSVAKKVGISKDRIELYLDYDDAKKFDFRKLQWDPSYSAVLVGPMPHSVKDKGDYSSIIAAMEKTEGYPPVFRMGTNQLKISKSGFRNMLQELIETGKIA